MMKINIEFSREKLCALIATPFLVMFLILCIVYEKFFASVVLFAVAVCVIIFCYYVSFWFFLYFFELTKTKNED